MTTILIIDKNSSTAFRTKKVLFGKAVDIISVSSSDEAFTKTYKNVDILIVDINLGDDDGFNVIKKYYEINPNTKVIVVTSSNTRKDFVRGVRLGINDYILKPFDDLYFQKKMLSHLVSDTTTKIDVEAILYESVRKSIISNHELLVGLMLVYNTENPIKPVANVPLVKGFYSKVSNKLDEGITEIKLLGKAIPHSNNGRVIIIDNAKLSEKQNVIKYFDHMAKEYFKDTYFKCELEFISLPHEVPKEEKILTHLTNLIEKNLEVK